MTLMGDIITGHYYIYQSKYSNATSTVAVGNHLGAIASSTRVIISASAGYPFSWYSPTIDCKLNILFVKLCGYSDSPTVYAYAKVEHNSFPDYELLIDTPLQFSYRDMSTNYTGPSSYNLGLEWMEDNFEWKANE
jgi:hypothetical protein